MCQKILVEDLGVWHMSVQFVPRLFSDRWSSNFWALEMWLWSCNVLTCLIWPLVTFSCFGEWNCNYGNIISRMFWNLGTFMYHPTYSYKKLPAVTEMLDVLYKLRSVLLWREPHDSCKFSVHFFINTVQKLLYLNSLASRSILDTLQRTFFKQVPSL